MYPLPESNKLIDESEPFSSKNASAFAGMEWSTPLGSGPLKLDGFATSGVLKKLTLFSALDWMGPRKTGVFCTPGEKIE